MRKFIDALLKEIKKGKDISKLKNKLARKYKLKKIPKNIEILNSLSKKEKKQYEKYFITKPIRTLSGVAPIAIMTKPISCIHGKCIMCPGGPNSVYGNVPQSYTGKEPATMRGIRNKFDSYLQVMNRLEHYIVLGQIPEKVELIIMGGTFPSFDKKYQEDFVKYAFKAMNDFSDLFYKKEFDSEKFKTFFELPGDVGQKERIKKIHSKLLKLKANCILEKEQTKNETSKIKCVALAVETRPDYCREEHVKQMLKLGCTRVELGVQTVYNSILNKINRGHDVNETIKATKLLKDSGLKVIYHLMPSLPGSSYKKDLEMFRIIFSDERFKPDGLKIYPCVVIRGTKLYELWKKKKYKPLEFKKLVQLIIEIKKFVPKYCRIIRIQRDISSKEILAGIKMTNLRQHIQAIMKKENIICNCIRCREIRSSKLGKVEFKILKYGASNGNEYFISAETGNNMVGFCRLRLNKNAFIRELHVYGKAVSIGKRGKIQHKGFGKKLLNIAEKIAKQNKFKKLLILSGVGVREYYKKLGYKKVNNYMVKAI